MSRRIEFAGSMGAGLVLGLALVLAGCSNTGGLDPIASMGASDPTSSAGASAASGAGAGEPTASPSVAGSPAPLPSGTDVGTVALPAASVGDPVSLEGGVVVTVSKVQEVELSGGGPGEISGPGVAVELTLDNDSGSDLNLSGTAVNAFFGDTPASPMSSADKDVFTGILPSGHNAKATYHFVTPDGATGDLSVQVEHNSSKYVAVFTS